MRRSWPATPSPSPSKASPKYVTTKDAVIEAGAVILATGKPMPKERLIPGEDRLIGQGVSYCATCDGPLFRGATVAAVGHAEEALHDVHALQSMGCKVLWVPGKDGRGGRFARKPRPSKATG